MTISDRSIAAITLALITSTLQADIASFNKEHGKLSGTLEAISEDGIILWASPHSKDPLKLRADKVDQIELDSSETAPKLHPVQITLRNGDVLPASGITAMGAEGLVAESPVAGVITVPRPALASAQFGITEQKVIYQGFDNIRLWTRDKGEPENWRLRDDSLLSTGPSIAARDFDLPRNFAFSFSLEWEGNSPNYTITFADPLVKESQKEDFYRFEFDRSGMRISRHKDQARSRTLAQWQRHPDHFEDSRFDVRIEVNRDSRQLELFINGESEGVIIDPMQSIPSASGFSFSCQTSTGGTQVIRNLQISELNDSRTRHLAEKRGNPSLDCMITNDEDRWSGELLSMAGTAEQSRITFKTNFAKEAWDIPQSEVSTIFFADMPFKIDENAKPTYLLEFHGKGKLSVSNCVVTDEQVQATHPLLGALVIDRKAIHTIHRIAE